MKKLIKMFSKYLCIYILTILKIIYKLFLLQLRESHGFSLPCSFLHLLLNLHNMDLNLNNKTYLNLPKTSSKLFYEQFFFKKIICTVNPRV